MPTLNGREYTAAILTGTDGYGYAQPHAATGNTIFPDQIFTDMLAEIALANTYDVGVFVQDVAAAGETVLRFVAPRAFTLPASLTGSRASAATAATGEAVFSLKKAGVEFGTATFAASGTTATFAAASETSFAAGDVLTIVAPASADATLADISIVLNGTVG